MSAKRTILHIIADLAYGGAARQMSRVAASQQKSGFDVHIRAGVGGPLENELRDSRVGTGVIEYRGPLDLPALWKLRRDLKQLDPALIHVWGEGVGGLLAVVRCTVGDSPLVITQPRPEPCQSPFDLAVARYLCKRCRRLVVNASAHREALLRRGLPAEKVLAIPCGTPSGGPSPITRRQLLDELGLPQGSRLIGVVGRLALRKHLKDAIWAADLLKVIRDDVHLLIIGDGPHRARLHMFRDQVEIRDKVHFLGARGDVAGLLPHLDVFWSASSREGHSAAILEAMAAGRPVVAADIPGNRELMEADSTGYLVPVGDRAAIAQATNRLLDDAELAARVGAATRDRAMSHFPVEKMLDAYGALYEELL